MNRLLQLSLFIIFLPGHILGQSYTVIENKTENSDTDVSTFSSPTLGKQHFDHPDHFIRCLTPIIEEYENNPESRSALGPILGVDSIEELHQKHITTAEIANYEEYLSESGRFLIRFKRTGTGAVSDVDADENGIPDYVDSTATYADYSWDHLVDELGFNDPIPNLDNPLIIRIDSLSRGVYGSYSHSSRTINVQNSYSGFPPNLETDNQELGALKVTIAHEFKHAIQFVTYRNLSGGWIELDATMAEEVVYPTVKDYLNYLTSTQNPSISLNPQRTVAGNPLGYYHVTAGLFYREKFGDDFWVNVWERLQNGEATGSADYMHKAISLELASRGYSPDMEFVNLYLWHYAAGTRSTEEFGFKDRLLYPDIRLSNTDLNKFLPFKSPNITLNSKAAYVYEFYTDATLTPGENVMVGIFRSQKIQSFDGRIHVGLIAYYKNGSIAIANIDLNEDTELISFYGSPLGFIGGHIDWNLDEIQKIGVVVANTTPQTQNQTNPTLPRAQLIIGTSSNPSPNKFGKIISNENALEEAHAEALLERLVSMNTAPSLNNPIDFIAADVSANETISAYDASLILQKKENNISAFPADPQNQIFAPQPTWYTEFNSPIAAKSSGNTDCFQIDCNSNQEITDDPIISFVSVFGDPDNPNNVADDILRVKISVNTDQLFHSGLFEINYADTLLEFVDHEISSLIQTNSINKRSTTNGNLKLAIASSEVIFDAESVLTLNFRPIKMDSTDVTLRLSKLELDEQISVTPDLTTTNKVKGNGGVSIERPTEIPISTTLHPAYPNPFNPTTTIPFSISERRAVTIQIFDITGRHISTVSNDIYPPGLHTVRFDAVNLSSGMYIARMVVTDPNGFSPAEMFIQRLTLIK